MSAARPSGFSASPIPFSEIDAYMRVTATELSTFEVRLIRDCDLAALLAIREPEEKPPPVRMTPEAFKAAMKGMK